MMRTGTHVTCRMVFKYKLLILASVNLMSATVKGGSVFLSGVESTWGETPLGCLPIPDFNDYQAQAEISEAIQGTVWLPIRLVTTTEWHWNSTRGELYGNQISTKDWVKPGLDCAVLRSLDKIVDDVFCDREYGYYICQGLQNCDAHAHSCLKVAGVTYNIYNKTGTWYDASEGCFLSRRQTLAVFRKSMKEKALEKLAQHFQKWANIWIGLVKSEFQIKDKKDQVRIFKWDLNEPAALENKCCVVALLKKEEVVWRMENCNATFQHICYSQKLHTTEQNQCRSTISRDRRQLLWIILFSGSTLCALLLLFLLIQRKFSTFKKKRMNDQPNETEMSLLKATSYPDEGSQIAGQKESVLDPKSRTEEIFPGTNIKEAGSKQRTHSTKALAGNTKDDNSELNVNQRNKLKCQKPIHDEMSHSEGSYFIPVGQGERDVIHMTGPMKWHVKYFPAVKEKVPDMTLDSKSCLFSIDTSTPDCPEVHIDKTKDRKRCETISVIYNEFHLREDKQSVYFTVRNRTTKAVFNDTNAARKAFDILKHLKKSCTTLHKSNVVVKTPENDDVFNASSTELQLFQDPQDDIIVSIVSTYERQLKSVKCHQQPDSAIVVLEELHAPNTKLHIEHKSKESAEDFIKMATIWKPAKTKE